jgi:cell fate (sporulation/competence/biofilm development) regulator YlbF (YheA/YmcA/DUF963 family)
MNSFNTEDLTNIDNYPGVSPNQIIPPYISNIKSIFENLEENTTAKKAIDTYIRLLEYYKEVSDSSSHLLQSTLIFCEQLTSYLNDYVKQKYPMYNINVELKGRIKSPVSAITKFRMSISEYLKNGKDLDSLIIKDLFAFRLIVEVHDKNEILQDDNISIPICYDVIEQAFKFCKSNDNIDLLTSTARSEKNVPIIHDIVVPKTRPKFIIENENYIKDYIIYPKSESNYQSAHIKLSYTDKDTNQVLLFEMQIRTHDMDEHAEKGPASHKTYKSRNLVSFSRVPQIVKRNKNGKVFFINMNDAFQEFYNFPISYINPELSYEYLNNFLVQTNFKIPVGVLNIARNSIGNLDLTDFGDIKLLPLEVPRLIYNSNDSLDQNVFNLFSTQTISANDVAER